MGDIDGETERSNGAFGKTDIEGKAARGSGERAGTRTSFKWAGAHESMRATSEFQSSERDERHERQSRERSGDRGGSRGNQNRVACARVLPLIKAIPQTGCNHCVR